MSVLESFNLNGRVAVVTGGAGLFGRQIVAALAEAGARTYTASRDIEKLTSHAADLARHGLDVHALPLDQSREESVRQLLQSVTDREGGVDILVNNAVLQPMKGFDSPVADFARSMEINATGIFMMTRS